MILDGKGIEIITGISIVILCIRIKFHLKLKVGSSEILLNDFL